MLRRVIAEAVSLDDRSARPGSLAPADAMIAVRHAEAVEAFLSAESMSPEEVDLVGSMDRPFCIGQIGVSLFRSATAELLLRD